MRATAFVILLFASALAVGSAEAQPAPFNETGVTMGHWHLASKDVEANKKIFLGMGGKLFMPGGNPLMMFPGVYINLNLGTEKGEGGTPGSVVNHVGFIVNNVQEQVEKWKAAGVPVLPGINNRGNPQAFVVTPDGVRMEILEDKAQACRSAMSTSISCCRKQRSRRLRPGTPRPSAARRARATTRRSWTCPASSSVSGTRRKTRDRPRRRRRAPADASSTTSASM